MLRPGAYWLLEIGERVVGPDRFTPPSWLPLVGTGDFTAVGEEYLGYFINLGQLKPTEYILEIGCGIGRMVLPLTRYLVPPVGRYLGFDIDRRAIRWCQRHIASRHPNFLFQHADVTNRNYYLGGQFDGSAYHFPYPDNSFDFIIAVSVFTHLLPASAENYLRETARVLRSGGRCFATFFLLNAEARENLQADVTHVKFPYDYRDYRLLNAHLPEAAVAHDEAMMRAWCEKNGLRIHEPIAYGNWSGRRHFVNGQDILIATKA